MSAVVVSDAKTRGRPSVHTIGCKDKKGEEMTEPTTVELKARIYDLLAARQQIDAEIEQLTRKIQNEFSRPTEVPKVQES